MHPRVWDLVDTSIQIRSIGSFCPETPPSRPAVGPMRGKRLISSAPQHFTHLVQRTVVTFSQEIVSMKHHQLVFSLIVCHTPYACKSFPVTITQCFSRQPLPTRTCNLCPVHGSQESPDGLVLSHVLWRSNTQLFLNRCMEECHRLIPQAESTAMTTRCRTGQNETHCCKWWCGRKHVFALACTSDLLDHQSRPHWSWSFL